MGVVKSYHWEEIWPFMRDYAKPTTPFAAEQLEKCRTYSEPSKAHKKRLLKPRTEVRIVPKAKPKPVDASRKDAAMLMRYARQSRSIVQKDKFRHA